MPTIEDSAGDGNDAAAAAPRRIAVRGDLTMASIGGIIEPLRAITPAGADLAVDLGGVDSFDTAGAWIIHRLTADWTAAGVPTRIENASPEAERLIAVVAANDVAITCRIPRGNIIVDRLSRIGVGLVTASHNIGAFLSFLGHTLLVLFATMVGRRTLRWNAFIHQCEAIGVSALGIVGLLLFLVGIVVAQQGATQLRQFGAEIFVVNLVGRSLARELGVLLTAIMVAGRSASAFAAQIGSMKLNQEVDALATIGLSPIEVLVIPRVVAMALMLTLLGFYGICMAILGGGLFAWVSLDIPPAAFFTRIQEVTPLSDLVIGLIKAPVFGIIIAMMGCFQGLQVSGNAESVGERTTRAVVESIFAVIVLDAFFAVFFSALGYN
ncbi:MAG: MlaE family lipid ABC transporter permease subunit [Sandarakinorhabdus sp.]|nr:MlaE family lipid ABC transporter permease subunit [Sandarakinorhabdus sp.]